MKKASEMVYANEDMLIEKCIEWDRHAQNVLYNKYASTMFAVCCRYSRNTEEAEDVLQEGFMKVFEHINKFRKEGSLEGWIRRIMVNTAIQKFRNRKNELKVVDLESSHAELNQFYTDDILSQIGAKELIGMIQNLPPAYQMVFNLYVFEGLKHREIAEQLGVSEGTSKSNLFDARAILQKNITGSLKTDRREVQYNGGK